MNNLSHHEILSPISVQTVVNYINKGRSPSAGHSGMTNQLLKQLPQKKFNIYCKTS